MFCSDSPVTCFQDLNKVVPLLSEGGWRATCACEGCVRLAPGMRPWGTDDGDADAMATSRLDPDLWDVFIYLIFHLHALRACADVLARPALRSRWMFALNCSLNSLWTSSNLRDSTSCLICVGVCERRRSSLFRWNAGASVLGAMREERTVPCACSLDAMSSKVGRSGSSRRRQLLMRTEEQQILNVWPDYPYCRNGFLSSGCLSSSVTGGQHFSAPSIAMSVCPRGYWKWQRAADSVKTWARFGGKVACFRLLVCPCRSVFCVRVSCAW